MGSHGRAATRRALATGGVGSPAPQSGTAIRPASMMAVADISARASTRRRGAERRPRSSRLASRRLPASASLFSRHATSQARLDEAGRSRAGTRQHGRTEIGRRHHGRKLRSSKSRRIWNRTIASGPAPILLPPTFTESGSSAKAGWIKTGPVMNQWRGPLR